MMGALSLLAEVAANAEHEPTLLGLAPEGWVYVGISIFFLIAIFGAKAHRKVIAALDEQIAATKRSLKEAAESRVEAEGLLASAKTQQAEVAANVTEMLAHAQHEAEAIVAKAQADTTAMIGRREKMAQDKIGAAERAAVDELRARAADTASRAAAVLIAQGHSAKSDKALVDETIAGL